MSDLGSLVNHYPIQNGGSETVWLHCPFFDSDPSGLGGGVIHWQEFVRLHCPSFLSGLISGFESTLSLSVFTDPYLFVRVSTNLWKRGSVPFPFETFLLIVCAASLPRLSDVHTVLKGKKEKT